MYSVNGPRPLLKLPCSWIFARFFAFFRTFGGILNQLGNFDRFFSNFYRFGQDLGSIWEGFGGHFLRIFRIFLENVDFVTYSVFPRENQ